MTPAPINRRRAIVLGGLGAAAASTGLISWMATDADTSTGGGPVPADTGNELLQPLLLDSRDGHLEVAITAAAGVRLAGRDTQALGYNGTSPGPTLRLRPGDELAVRLTNHLDRPTNLHTHGLRVSPQGNSDNPFLRIDPGTSFDYRIEIPSDHPAGTFWYHPHHHGMVTDQIFGGLAGALLVEPPAEQPPQLLVSADHVLLITDITLAADGTIASTSPMDRNMGRQGEMLLINGQHQPTIAARPGAMQRWRIINACVSRVLAVHLQGHQLLHIANDGTFLPVPAMKQKVVLAPGNRADVVVSPTTPGRYDLTTEPFSRGRMGGSGGAEIMSERAALATMVVSGQPTNAPPPLPGPAPVEATGAGAVTAQRRVVFEMREGEKGAAATFLIDGRPFDPARDDQTIALGAIEEWTITNTTPMVHPFHLHVWPVTLLASSDGTPPLGVPQDVVLIPARGWVRLRIPFTKLTGRTVYHCHILDHEDLGMMATIIVNP